MHHSSVKHSNNFSSVTGRFQFVMWKIHEEKDPTFEKSFGFIERKTMRRWWELRNKNLSREI